MKLSDLEKVYFHGSYHLMNVGEILSPRENYEKTWSGADFYIPLEHYRPKGIPSHKESVFMVENAVDIDAAGGGTEYVFEVIPLGKVYRFDMGWSSEISILLSDGYTIESIEVKNAAMNYWNGIKHPSNSLYEYCTSSAKIVDVYEY